MRALLLLMCCVLWVSALNAEVQFCPPFRAHECAHHLSLELSYCNETSTTIRIVIEYQATSSNKCIGILRIDKGDNSIVANESERRVILKLLMEASQSDAFEKYDVGGRWLMNDLEETLFERCIARRSTNGVFRSEIDKLASEVEERFYADFKEKYWAKYNNCGSGLMKHATELAVKLLTVGVEKELRGDSLK